MTEFQIVVFDFLFCGNNGILDDVHLSGKTKNLRRHSRESGNLEFQCRKNLSGMPGFKGLDSRLRGNDGSKVTKRKITETEQAGLPPARE
ncbi:TPA: hypothetical protein WJI05_001008 [Neisseria meningitidis]